MYVGSGVSGSAQEVEMTAWAGPDANGKECEFITQGYWKGLGSGKRKKSCAKCPANSRRGASR
jgi:hypothetical protein